MPSVASVLEDVSITVKEGGKKRSLQIKGAIIIGARTDPNSDEIVGLRVYIPIDKDVVDRKNLVSASVKLSKQLKIKKRTSKKKVAA